MIPRISRKRKGRVVRIAFPRVAVPTRDCRQELWTAVPALYLILHGVLHAVLHATWGGR
jgi:hypothetical protein